MQPRRADVLIESERIAAVDEDQGFENVSHGCVNLSPEHAEIYYKLAAQGDPVTVTGEPHGRDLG